MTIIDPPSIQPTSGSPSTKLSSLSKEAKPSIGNTAIEVKDTLQTTPVHY